MRRVIDRKKPDESTALVVDTHVKAGRLQEALSVARAWVSASPELAEAHSALALAHHASGETLAAIATAERAVGLAPRNAKYLARWAAVLLAAGRTRECIRAAREALALDEGEDVARVNLGVALMQVGQVGEAIDVLTVLDARETLSPALLHPTLEALARESDRPAARALEARLRTRIAQPLAPRGSDRVSTGTLLSRVGRDLTELARNGALDPVRGRDLEINHVIDVLCRQRKSNPCLVGPAGVGKTAVVEGLAQRIAAGSVPARLQRAKIIEVSATSLMAGTSLRGELESRLQRLLEELREDRNVLLFVDEVHTLARAGAGQGELSLAEALKPAMARGDLSLIGATTPESFERSIQRDPALARRFERVEIAEPNDAALGLIVEALSQSLSRHHALEIPSVVGEQCVSLVRTWLPDRPVPDVLADVLDRACALASQAAESKLTEGHLERAIAALDGRDVSRLRELPSQQLARLSQALFADVCGNHDALRGLATMVSFAALSHRVDARPSATLWLAGPASVGKHTTLARLAHHEQRPLLRIDLGALSERQDVAKLLGATPGYAGYEDGAALPRALRQRPTTLLVLDHPERAHAEVLQLLAGALAQGSLVDARGEAASLRRALVVFVSDRETRTRGGLGFDPRMDERAAIHQADPLLGRQLASLLDGVISFETLDASALESLAKRQLDQTVSLLGSLQLELTCDPAVVQRLARDCKTARELQMRVRSEILHPALTLATTRQALRVELSDDALRVSVR
ncbi:MAG: AAA family ATPase [Deltaproteobacteria bacterium]|nr:AAA family ATPase [Deltaproteobacteria bacterium]